MTYKDEEYIDESVNRIYKLRVWENGNWRVLECFPPHPSRHKVKITDLNEIRQPHRQTIELDIVRIHQNLSARHG